MMDYKVVHFTSHTDQRGSLVALEQNREVPFEIKRIYYIYGVTSTQRRGYHAHHRLKQVLLCLNGSCKIHVDDGKHTQEITLDQPDVGLYLENLVWREMYDFTPNSVLLVLASELYDESDYIRDYNDFIKIVTK